MSSLTAHAAPVVESPHNVKTIVRADKRTGRLVRALVVTAPIPPHRSAQNDPAAEVPAGAGAAFAQLVERTARAYDVDPLLVHSVIQVESNYNPYAVSSKGARGLMQLIPGTARRFGVSNTFDAGQNVDAGVRYLRYLQDLFGDDRLAIAAYNAGEGAVLKHGKVPPYPETKNYVAEVGRRLERARQAAQSQKVVAPVQLAKEPEFRALQSYRDQQGRLYLRTE